MSVSVIMPCSCLSLLNKCSTHHVSSARLWAKDITILTYTYKKDTPAWAERTTQMEFIQSEMININCYSYILT